MDRNKKLGEPREAMNMKLTFDAACDLACLHPNEFLHGDIKPDNVLVFELDDVLVVNRKLIDF